MLLLSDELTFFSLSFLDEDGSWQDAWDSSQLVRADELPVAVRIELELAPEAASDDAQFEAPDGDLDEAGAARFRRTVVLPLRPLDLVTLADPKGPYGAGGRTGDNPSGEDEEGAGEGEENDEQAGVEDASCPSRRTVRDCFNIEAAQRDVDAGGSAGPSSIATFWNNPTIAGSCFDNHRTQISTIFIRPECL